MKIEKIWNFGRISAVNWRYRNASGTSECTELLLDNYTTIWRWKYHRINRPRQRYDYEMALADALCSLLDRISWKQYEELKDDIDKIRWRLQDMHDYNWSNRH